MSPSCAIPSHGVASPVNSSRLPKLEARRGSKVSRNPIPLPETPELPPPPSTAQLQFERPSRRILTARDHELFLASPTFDLLLAFVFGLSEAAVDVPISRVLVEDASPLVWGILGVLERIEDAVKQCPPEFANGSRFGNSAFRTFLDMVAEKQLQYHNDIGVQSPNAISELSTYLLQSFGNRTRIDYGSGHELNFVVWLLCLYQLGILPKVDFRAVTLLVFTRYLELMRLVQSTYYLEPAGSHGVWGLDDYQFLPFLFGASQLLHHPFIRPLSIHQTFVLEQYGKDYMYLGQVNYINSIKNVEGLRWHSPMLDDISAAKTWDKVEGGMKRMFVAEVLRKLPVMQHFLFGSLVPALEGMSREDSAAPGRTGSYPDVYNNVTVIMQDGMPHVHQANSWGDCCGIKVPSSVAVAQETSKTEGGNCGRLRRIPFD